MSDSLFKQSVSWLESQIDSMSFGEVSIRIIIHEGSIKRIEKGTIEKTQIEH